MRIFLQIILPLITPIVLYSIWSYYEAKRQGKGIARWEEGHWFWAIVIGVFLSAGTLVYFATTGADTDAEYQSPRLQDGRIIPGKHN